MHTDYLTYDWVMNAAWVSLLVHILTLAHISLLSLKSAHHCRHALPCRWARCKLSGSDSGSCRSVAPHNSALHCDVAQMDTKYTHKNAVNYLIGKLSIFKNTCERTFDMWSSQICTWTFLADTEVAIEWWKGFQAAHRIRQVIELCRGHLAPRALISPPTTLSATRTLLRV